MRAASCLAFPAGIFALGTSLALAFSLLAFAGATDWLCDKLDARAERVAR